MLDGDCLGLKIGESSLGTKLPACSRLLETSERCLKNKNLGHLEHVVVVVGVGGLKAT